MGECARIGANAVVTRDVEPRTTMVGIPAKPVQLSRAEQGAIDRFVAYGTPLDVSDPVKADNEALRDQIAMLKARLNRHRVQPAVDRRKCARARACGE